MGMNMEKSDTVWRFRIQVHDSMCLLSEGAGTWNPVLHYLWLNSIMDF